MFWRVYKSFEIPEYNLFFRRLIELFEEEIVKRIQKHQGKIQRNQQNSQYKARLCAFCYNTSYIMQLGEDYEQNAYHQEFSEVKQE